MIGQIPAIVATSPPNPACFGQFYSWNSVNEPFSFGFVNSMLPANNNRVAIIFSRNDEYRVWFQAAPNFQVGLPSAVALLTQDNFRLDFATHGRLVQSAWSASHQGSNGHFTITEVVYHPPRCQ